MSGCSRSGCSSAAAASSGIGTRFCSPQPRCPRDIVKPRHRRSGSGSSEEGILYALDRACSVQNLTQRIPRAAYQAFPKVHTAFGDPLLQRVTDTASREIRGKGQRDTRSTSYQCSFGRSYHRTVGC